ncbi:hypothetical protein Syun_013750 [Stephania yunnanensis]|uniref:Peroxidase n=1 Tax=Stephania yunnanensis TaxID=152371 RepID=A0AAP0JIT1_9MAGN
MGMAFSPKAFHPLILLLFSLVLVSHLSNAQTNLPIVPGLSWTFYNTTCPRVEAIIKNRLTQIFQNDSAQAAGLLRLHFHDCFVQGCDGSVLLDGSASGPSEKNAPPNLSLRARSFTIINELRDLIQTNCGRVVSCSDIVAIAARDSVAWSGGPNYSIPLGRRDGLTFATRNETLRNLPPPTSSAGQLLAALAANQNLSATDLVALSGGHTIGFSSCFSFRNRLFPTQDFTMNLTLAGSLRLVCPTNTTTNFTFLDPRTPRLFDNQYYVNLVNREGLFTSDRTCSPMSGLVTLLIASPLISPCFSRSSSSRW